MPGNRSLCFIEGPSSAAALRTHSVQVGEHSPNDAIPAPWSPSARMAGDTCTRAQFKVGGPDRSANRNRYSPRTVATRSFVFSRYAQRFYAAVIKRLLMSAHSSQILIPNPYDPASNLAR